MKRSLAALVVVFGLSAAADELSWNYLDGLLVNSKAAEGGALNGALSFADRWLFQASYLRLNPDDVSGNAQEMTFGLGYRLPVASSTDVLLGGGYGYFTTSFDALDNDAHGGYLSAVIRSRFIDRLEVEAFVRGTASADTDIVDHDVGYGISGRYYFTRMVAVSLGVADSDQAEDPVFTLGLRLEGLGFSP